MELGYAIEPDPGPSGRVGHWRIAGIPGEVMARLGADDLETLDTLFNAGIATSRADAVRWALARIRERPAYGDLRQRAQEIERLKTQF